MENFYIIDNRKKDPECRVAGEILDFLHSHDKKCEIVEENSVVPDNADCCLVLGGDGTMLRAARSVLGRNIPLLGVNLGTLGYLAEVEKGNISDALMQLISGVYELDSRMMLCGSCEGHNRNYALNDIVIARKELLQIINFNLYVNDMLLSTYRADGIIISTPTGSTGYNMSAGGPIVEPGARMILVTPICSHNISGRSIVLSPEDKVVVEIGEGKDDTKIEAEANCDGTSGFVMSTGDRIEISKADITTSIIRLSHISFLELLHRKLV